MRRQLRAAVPDRMDLAVLDPAITQSRGIRRRQQLLVVDDPSRGDGGVTGQHAIDIGGNAGLVAEHVTATVAGVGTACDVGVRCRSDPDEAARGRYAYLLE